MADGTKIEWTDATWNPVTGCSVTSPGCTNCYAMKLAGGRLKHHPSRAGLTTPSKAGPVWNGQVRFNEAELQKPLHWKKPRMIFVCAHGDLFHENVPDEWIDQVFAIMALCPQHTFQVLTKRANRMKNYLTFVGRDMIINSNYDWPLPNVWLGVSVENQTHADERIPHLLKTPAVVHFVSCEPLLGRISFFPWLNLIDWAIVGGESGPGARPMHPSWAKSIKLECQVYDTPFFFKQWGAWKPLDPTTGPWPTNEPTMCCLTDRGYTSPIGWPMQRVGKKHAGRLLDGVEHNAMPQKT